MGTKRVGFLQVLGFGVLVWFEYPKIRVVYPGFGFSGIIQYIIRLALCSLVRVARLAWLDFLSRVGLFRRFWGNSLATFFYVTR